MLRRKLKWLVFFWDTVYIKAERIQKLQASLTFSYE